MNRSDEIARDSDERALLGGSPSVRRTTRDILTSARTIAVVGMSNRLVRESNSIGLMLRERGYQIVPVNPTIDNVAGIPAVDSLEEIEASVDIVNVFRHPDHAMAIVESAAAINAPVIWFQLGAEEPNAIRRAEQLGLQVIFDRCIAVELSRHGIRRDRAAGPTR